MPYVIIGEKSLYQGRPLFKLLTRLKDCGKDRIVYRTFDYYQHPDEIHFYRILHAQPDMDKDTIKGRVVAERIFRNIRYQQPVLISDQVYKPDFRLVPKAEEAAFCQWDKIEDYVLEKHAPKRAESMEMPPLLREVVRRSRAKRGESVADEHFLLPAHKVYEGDTNIVKGEVTPNLMANYLTDEFATHRDFDMGKIDVKEWNLERHTRPVGQRKWAGFVEGDGWEEQKERDEQEREYLASVASKISREDAQLG